MIQKPKILLLAGSIRSGAYSQQLSDAFTKELLNHDCEITRITLADYALPIMDQNLESEKGVPQNAIKLAKLFDQHHGLVITTPEYNGSLPPLLKNAIDWMSRVNTEGGKKITPFKEKYVAIGSTSPGAMGGYACLSHLRDIMVRLGSQVISEQLAIGNAANAFTSKDQLANERQQNMLTAACKSLTDKSRFLS